jgi:hypothetical protein
MPELNAVETPRPKFVVEYQITDEGGQPLTDPRTGRPMFTNLTAETPEEMFEKQKQAHINAVRLAARLRTQRAVAKEPEPARKEMSAEEQRTAVAELTDPVKAPAAIRKLAGVDEIETAQKKLQEQQAAAASQRAAYQFMSAHIADYYPCRANSEIMTDYINAEKLDPAVADNYEIAFDAVHHKLAQRPAPPVAQPTPEPQPEPRRQAAGGIQPGELSGTRPIQRKQSGKYNFTKREIADMSRDDYRKRLKDPEFQTYVNNLYAK